MFRSLLAGGAIAVTIALMPACTERTLLDPDSTGAPPSELPVDDTTNGVDDLIVVEHRFGDEGERINVAVGGIGLRAQPAVLSLDVPAADDTAIREAWFSWSGRSPSDAGDETIVIDGTEHTGTLLAKFPHSITPERWAFVYRLDAMSLVHAGANSFEVSGFDLGENANVDGISLVVLFADPGGYTHVDVLELADFFYWAAPETGGNSGVHSFEFAAAGAELDANLVLVVGDCEEERPDALWWEIGEGEATGADLVGLAESEANVLVSAQGAELDVVSRDLVIPADAGHVSFQIESPHEGDGDSGLLTLAVFCLNSELENLPPVCDAGGPYEAFVGETILLDGSGSSDPDGKITSWVWDVGDKGTLKGEMVEYTWFVEPGDYTIELCVSDGGRATTCCEAEVLITAPPEIECDAGGPYEGAAGEVILFDGSGTEYPGGKYIMFEWDFGDGTFGDGEFAEHVYAEPGEYDVTLCVWDYYDEDGRGGPKKVCCETTATISGNGVVCDPGGPYEGLPETPLMFDGSGTLDPQQVIVGAEWSFGDGESAKGLVVTHDYDEAGDYTAVLCLFLNDKSKICCDVEVNIINIILPSTD